MFYKYADTIETFLSSGYKILNLLEDFEIIRHEISENDFSNRLDLIEGDFRAWKISVLSYLKIYFSRDCNIYIGLLEKETICNISTVKLHLNILSQVRNGVLEEIVHPDSYLMETDKILKETRDDEEIENRLYELNKKIMRKIPTMTMSFVIALASFIFIISILWMIDPVRLDWRYPYTYHDLLRPTNVMIAIGISFVIGALFFLIRYSMLISSLDRLEGEAKVLERRRKSTKADDVVSDVSDSVQNRLFEEMPSQIAKQIIEEIISGNIMIETSRINPYDNITTHNGLFTDESRSVFRTQMKELFHSLMTPITTVNRSLTNISISKTDDNFTEVLDENLESIKNSMSYIDALLYAYRSMAMLNFNPKDSNINLRNFVTNTITSLCEQINKRVNIKIDDSFSEIEGFKSQFIVALLLPLLQNAVEASPDGSDILLSKDVGGDRVTIEIINQTIKLMDTNDLQRDNFTTKGNTHESLGLPTVRRISDEMNIVFDIRSEGKSVRVSLGFLKRIKK